MNLAEEIKRQINALTTLTFVQRTARLALRVAWLVGAGYLIGWSISSLRGSPEPRNTWLAIGFIMALPFIVGMYIPISPAKLAWRMDRSFGLKEQTTTAWEAAWDTQQGPLVDALLTDTLGIIEDKKQDIFSRGWFVLRDLEGLLIILALLGGFIAATSFNSSPLLTALSPDVPPLPQEPDREEIFPKEFPEDTNPGEGGGGGSPSEPQEPDPNEPQDPDDDSGSGTGNPELDDNLINLGQALAPYPETAQAGESLQLGNNQGAADAFQRLGQNLHTISPVTLENLQRSLTESAAGTKEAGAGGLAEAMQEAAEGLNGANPSQAEAGLSQFAEALRDLPSGGSGGESDQAGTASDGSGTGGGGGADGSLDLLSSAGDPEDINRLGGEGEPILLEGGQDTSVFLEEMGGPGQTDGSPAAGIAIGGSFDSDTTSDDFTPAKSLPPYHYLWSWRSVIGEYFTP